MIDVGKYAKVISKTAHTHRGHIGRVVGYTNNNRYVVLYFSDTRVKAQFEPGSITIKGETPTPKGVGWIA